MPAKRPKKAKRPAADPVEGLRREVASLQELVRKLQTTSLNAVGRAEALAEELRSAKARWSARPPKA